MSAVYQRFSYSLLPLLISTLVLSALHFTQVHWQDWLTSIESLPYWLLAAASLLAVQFNRSRLAYLGCLLLLFYLQQEYSFALFGDLSRMLLLGGAICICVFAFVKDRGLVSSHSLVRLVAIMASFGLAYGWLWGVEQYQAWVLAKLPWKIQSLWIQMLPLYLSAILVMVRCIWQVSLVNSAILITFAFWSLHGLRPELLPLSLLLSVLAFIYLFAILIDSYFFAYRDELTGLASRRALYNLVLALGRKYSVAMLDIDHFKKFNDTYGHDVGDQVLKLVAAKIAKVSGGGKPFRYGGEEFTIVFPRKETAATLAYLEDVRRSVEEYQIVLREDKRKQNSKANRSKSKKAQGKTVSVTISIGVASRIAGESFDQTMKKADEALYRAKKKGRNQVCT